MLKKTASALLYFYSLVTQTTVPCSLPEQLPVNTLDPHQYLGVWHFKAAASRNEADVEKFKALDSKWLDMKKTANDTLVLTGHMRIGENCVKQNWTYHIRPERDDLEMEGKTMRRNLLWSGTWADCPDCIIFQEIEPPLNPTDTVDSLNRFLLYARQTNVNSSVVTTFLNNAACNNISAHVLPPQGKEFCTVA